jgi:cystathionine beta-lyase
MDINHIINHFGEDREDYYMSATPPLINTANFVFKTLDDMREGLAHESELPFYTRGNNPTVNILQKKMAALEGTEQCLAFASGSAAVSAAIMANVSQGDHIICVRKPYSWTNKLLNLYLPRFGVTATMVDGTNVENFEAARTENTKLVILESPNSWTFEMQDVPAIAQWAKSHGIISIMDNSYCTPVNFQPAKHGVDIVCHSATKYLSGHSDVVAGILCCSQSMYERIFASEYMTLGAILSPYNASMILRGLRTLPLRLKEVANNTLKVVHFLESREEVDQIYYPFLPSHPQYALAMRDIKQAGGQFSITLNTEYSAKIEAFCNALQLFLMACSWGGYESLIFPALTLYTSENYKTGDLPPNMIRCYVGLDNPDDLIEDLKNGFEAMNKA